MNPEQKNRIFSAYYPRYTRARIDYAAPIMPNLEKIIFSHPVIVGTHHAQALE